MSFYLGSRNAWGIHPHPNPLPEGEGTDSLSQRRLARAAFTLIELLIVISIIAILAGLILTVTASVNKTKIRSKARTELGMMIMAIENYKAKMGHYPPDNPHFPQLNTLYYELLGTTNAGNRFVTLDGSASVAPAQFAVLFGQWQGANIFSGFENCSGKNAGDEGSVARRFLTDLKPSQVGTSTRVQDAKFLLCSIPSPYLDPNLSPQDGNRWRYVSSNPTNNPNGFDLWVDVKVGNRTNRICNWSREPLIVGGP